MATPESVFDKYCSYDAYADSVYETAYAFGRKIAVEAIANNKNQLEVQVVVMDAIQIAFAVERLKYQHNVRKAEGEENSEKTMS